MYFSDVLKIAAINIRKSSVRTWLTSFSIAIGVASVILIASLCSSGESKIFSEFDKLGIKGLTVYSNDSKAFPLFTEDVEEIRNNISNVEYALPIVVQYGSINIKNKSDNAVIWGIDKNTEKVMNFDLLYGKFHSSEDIKFAKNTVLVDAELAEKVYKRKNIVGKDIIIKVNNIEEKYKIIGVISPQKDGFNKISGGVIPDFLYIPYTSLNRMRQKTDINQIAIKCFNDNEIDRTEAQTIKLLDRRKGSSSGHSAENLSGYMNDIKEITGIIGFILSAIAGISLCVSGLGIMSTMISSANERKREIGVCMAIGAKSSDIAICFLAESAIISLVGGIIGAGFGLLISYLLLSIFNLPFEFSLVKLIIVEAISVICGVVFAVLPAKSASKLNPISALREE